MCPTVTNQKSLKCNVIYFSTWVFREKKLRIVAKNASSFRWAEL